MKQNETLPFLRPVAAPEPSAAPVVKQNGYALQHAAPEHKAANEFKLEALKQNGKCPQRPPVAAPEPSSAPVVKQNGCVLQHAAPKHKADSEFELEAMKQNETLCSVHTRIAPSDTNR